MLDYFKKIDFILILSIFGLLILGLVALYSTSHTQLGNESTGDYFFKQLIWVLIGIVVLIGLYIIPNRWIFISSYYLYFVSIFLLILVFLMGRSGQGAERWLQFGAISIQPSEFAKLATVLAVAKFISRENVNLNNIKDFFIASVILVIPFLLILRQPDLGTSIVFAAFALPMFYWGGLKFNNLILILMPLLVILASFQFYSFLILMIIFIAYLIFTQRSKVIIIINFLINIVMGLLTPVLWNNLKPYQRNRIQIFLNPEADPKGAGYQIIQSKVAIGSGGMTGKGFMEGSQTQLRFLPEQHTDFIYAVIGEEFGFFGAMIGLFFFFILLMRGVKIAALVKNRFNSVVAIGIVTIIAFHVTINIGMTVGILPVTGLPLPFISYGGSSLLTNMAMIGILLNFYKNRFEY
jgi:rod shape determining protein RodA